MALRSQRSFLALLSLSPSVIALAVACGGSSGAGSGADSNGDNVADDLGRLVDQNGDGQADTVDLDGDGRAEGFALDSNGDGSADAVALDTDCDGLYDSIDTNRDGRADFASSKAPPRIVPGCIPGGDDGPSVGGTSSGAGGSNPSAGSAGRAGAGNTSGTGNTGGSSAGGSGGSGPSELGMGDYQGTGSSTDRYAESDLYRDGVGYKFIANGWGSGWQSHKVGWNGTSFKVDSLNGSVGENYSPAGYPTVFCGLYSEPPKPSAGSCGLPASVSSLKTVKTGWRWKANGNAGQYNAAWDIWLGNGDSLSSYLMVWLRDPPGQQPAGSPATAGATIPGLPGTWSIWTGSVNGHPIVNYVKEEGQDLGELEYDVMDVYRDAIKRNYSLPGSNILAVAVGFEVWNGPITNLVSDDFYVDVN